MTPRPRLATAQASTRNAIRGAVRRHAATRTDVGVTSDTVEVTLATGERVVALIVIDLVPHPTQEPTP